MRYYSLTLIICLLIISCNRNTEAKVTNDTPSVNSKFELAVTLNELNLHKGLFYYKGEPFTGVATSIYLDGTISEKTAFAKGKKHGAEEKYFSNGVLSFKANYINGVRNGQTTSWWSNGNKRSIANYQNGIPHGKQYQWYTSGVKFKVITLVNGQEEGLQQSWRENGKIYNNYEAKNGRIFGLKRANLCFQLDDEQVQLVER